MTDNNNSGTILPETYAQLEWFWVLTTPITKNRDSILVVEMKEKDSGDIRRIVPLFAAKEDAEHIKDRLCQDKSRTYAPQAMRLSDIGNFAAKNETELMLLDAEGGILAHMEAKIEQVAVH